MRAIIRPLFFLIAFTARLLSGEPNDVKLDALAGLDVEGSLRKLGVNWDRVLLRDEPPGVFSRIVVPAEYVAAVEGAQPGKDLVLVPVQNRQLFSKERRWSREAIGKLKIGKAEWKP